MLDRWSIMVYETKLPRQHSASSVPEDCSEDSEVQEILTYEDSVAAHLSKILTSDQHSVVISSAKVLCETVKDFVARVGKSYEKNKESSEESESMAKKSESMAKKSESMAKKVPETTLEPGYRDHTGTRFQRPHWNQVTETTLEPGSRDHTGNRLQRPHRNQVSETTLEPGSRDHTGTRLQRPHWNQVPETTLEPGSRDHTGTRFQRPHWNQVPETTLKTGFRDHTGTRFQRPHWNQVSETTLEPGYRDHTGTSTSFLTIISSTSFLTIISSGSFLTIISSTSFLTIISSASFLTIISSPSFITIISSPSFLTICVCVCVCVCVALRGFSASLSSSSVISRLLVNADPFTSDPDNMDCYTEKCVMNNYFGIGLDAKISLDFNNKRDEHPEKCRSRTKNLMWYGVLGTKELLHRTYKKLEQKVLLECDGRLIPLPSLQGIAVLNIPSYAGGTNFWGGTKEDDTFTAPSFDDKVLEVVAVFGSMQMAVSRVINLQHHRIAQCRTVKITILGDEGVPVQVDGEAWLQPPGYIKILHKNRTQTLTRDRAFESTLKSWEDKQKCEFVRPPPQPVPSTQPEIVSEDETSLVSELGQAAGALIHSIREVAQSHPSLEQELAHAVNASSKAMDVVYAKSNTSGALSCSLVLQMVSNVKALLSETELLLAGKMSLVTACLSVSLSVCLSVCLPVSLSLCLSACLSVWK
ncbi:diacylglycerol kinase delta-like [Etheostoma cragini]|uniref:diacylglycerol kinase delta-like n=1 Tax=Etheostoma cragini TaxID=417921 RepID=UPI00155E0D14|nr:diacylglycerol kinase delta-like [Etheostoma cragini]